MFLTCLPVPYGAYEAVVREMNVLDGAGGLVVSEGHQGRVVNHFCQSSRWCVSRKSSKQKNKSSQQNLHVTAGGDTCVELRGVKTSIKQQVQAQTWCLMEVNSMRLMNTKSSCRSSRNMLHCFAAFHQTQRGPCGGYGLSHLKNGAVYYRRSVAQQPVQD